VSRRSEPLTCGNNEAGLHPSVRPA